MSTKIYYAYRIKRSEVPIITDFLRKLKNETKTKIASDPSLLKGLHASAFVWVHSSDEVMKDEADNFSSDNTSFDFVHLLYKHMKKQEQSLERSMAFNPLLECAVFMDSEHWYLKFFPNQGWHYDLVNGFDEQYDELEDFHYQNQTDPPEDIPLEEFEERDKKWDELCRGENNYRNGLVYTLSDAFEVKSIINKNAYTDKELYGNLEYKFDENFELNE